MSKKNVNVEEDLGFATVGLGTNNERKINIKSLSVVIIPDKKCIRFVTLENNEGYILALDNLINPETSFQNWIGEETLACILSSIFLSQHNKVFDIDSLFLNLPKETQTGFKKRKLLK
jgi:hypothetical protein